MRRRMIGLGLSVALVVGVGLPAWAQEAEESAAPEGAAESTEPVASEIPVTTKSGRPDLYLDMPYYIGGFEPDIVMTRGEEHFANLGADAPQRLQLEEMLETVGADTEDLVSGYALVSTDELFAFVVAIRVDGVEPGTLMPAYLPMLIGDLDDPSSEVQEVEGREVTVVTSVGDDGDYVELYLYDEGDTVWMVQGSRDVAEVTLADLPNPLSAE